MSSRFKLISPATAAMAATALMLASCSNDDVQVVNQGTEITFNTQVSRATEINLGNLKGFRVWGLAEGYTSMFINGEEAKKKEGEDGTYVLSKNYGPMMSTKSSFGLTDLPESVTMAVLKLTPT